MGLGWLIVHNQQNIVQFNASSFEWLLSTCMELMAVVSLISTLPLNSDINIFTDSNNMIEKYNKLDKHMSFRKKKKKFFAFSNFEKKLKNLTKNFLKFQQIFEKSEKNFYLR